MKEKTKKKVQTRRNAQKKKKEIIERFMWCKMLCRACGFSESSCKSEEYMCISGAEQIAVHVLLSMRYVGFGTPNCCLHHTFEGFQKCLICERKAVENLVSLIQEDN